MKQPATTPGGVSGLAWALIVAAMACAGDSASAPKGPQEAVLDGQQGNAQVSTTGTEVPFPLTLTVKTIRGAPVVGRAVMWSATDGGRVVADQPVTDDSGMVRATWTLGTRPGRQEAVASIDDKTYRYFATAATNLPLGELRPMQLQTFDGSGQTVHPDVVRVPRGWAPARRFLAITPYPGSNRTLENPSVYASGEMTAWEPLVGLKNPIAQASGENYLSDPDAVFDPDTRELLIYYRQVTKSKNVIFLVRSGDGVHWGNPVQVLSVPNHEAISPTIVRMGPRDWRMWAVNSGTVGCAAPSTTVDLRTSTDGAHWSSPQRTDFSDAPMLPWHLDVTWIPERGEFWALFNGKPDDSCSTPALYLATSVDGLTWHTFPTPVLEKGVSNELRDIVYRASLEYDSRADVATIWVSGAAYQGGAYVWSSSVERFERSTLFSRIERPPVSRRRIDRLGAPPKLMIAP